MQPRQDHPCKECRWLQVKVRGVYPRHVCGKYHVPRESACIDIWPKKRNGKEGDK